MRSPPSRARRPILLTGFEPFGGDAINPSWELVRSLHGTRIDGHAVVALQLRCVFGEAIAQLRQALDGHRPQLVLATGLAAGRAELSLERVAINVDDARIPDNAGAQPVDARIVPGGPVGYFSTLPIKAMAAAAREAGVPAGVSQTAGTFVCNHVFYGLMHALRRHRRVRAGFMHVPLLPGMADAALPTLPLQAQRLGTEAALAAALRWREGDLAQAGGAIA